ncbi:hypothetical protein niasHS_006214 [Heterodera schachtii]|uniref:Galectin domain-containing protein n=1 Tax=Heterodera schachtii TaxID=97005 RepID=A0ABD2JSL0_HETSC
MANAQLFFGIFAVLCSFLCQSVTAAGPHKNKIVYLSEPGLSSIEVEYNAIDQCLRRESRQRQINSFTLKFKLNGKCLNGLLMCYPGALDTHGTNYIFGMAPNSQFRVENQEENEVAKQCAAKRQEECQGDQKGDKLMCLRSSEWHGIRVSKPKSARKEFLLELSITNKSYPFECGNDFSIVFGNRSNLLTQLVNEKGESIQLLNGEEDALRNAFLARKGQAVVRLADYAGFWMLGLDFLPMHIRDTMHINVYRDCGCELHTWFLRPDENPKFVANSEWEMVPPIPANCPINVSDEKGKLVVKSAEQMEYERDDQRQSGGQPVKVSGKLLRVAFRVNKMPKNITIQLEDKQQKPILTLFIGAKHIVLNSEQKKSKYVEIKGVKDKSFLASQRQRYVEVHFVVYAFFYEIKLNGELHVRFFPWPYDWWTRANQTESFSSVSLSGDLYPDSVETHLTQDTQPRIPMPHAHLHIVEPMYVGDTAVFRGQVNSEAKSLMFYVLHNGHQINAYIGNALLMLQFNFSSDGQSNTLEAFYQQWDNDVQMNYFTRSPAFKEPRKGKYLQRGAPFQLEFELIANETKGNGTNLLMSANPLINVTLYTILDGVKSARHLDTFPSDVELALNNFGADGDVNLFQIPKIRRKGQVRNNILFYLLDPLLTVGDSIILEGKMKENCDYLRIFLLHDTVEPLKNESNIPLAIIFNFHSVYNKNFMHLQFNATDKFDKKKEGGQSKDIVFPSRLFSGQEFKIEIKVLLTEYRIFIHGAFVTSFAHRFPPWAVNCLRLDAELSKMAQIIRKKGGAVSTEPILEEGSQTKMPIIYRVPEEDAITPGNSVHIRSMTADSKTELRFGATLLYEALESYETVAPSVQQSDITKIGRVVLHVNFTNTDLFVYERFGNDELIARLSDPLKVPIGPDQPFFLDIRFGANQQFALVLNGIQLLNGSTTLPQWAIQYVRINGDLKPENTTIFIDNGA